MQKRYMYKRVQHSYDISTNDTTHIVAFQRIDWLSHSESVVRHVPMKKAVDVSQIETNRRERLSKNETHR